MSIGVAPRNRRVAGLIDVFMVIEVVGRYPSKGGEAVNDRDPGGEKSIHLFPLKRRAMLMVMGHDRC